MKKTSLLLLTAVSAAMLSSCGTSTYSVSNTEDGIYYRPSPADADGGWKEDRRISELKTRTASETGYGGSAQKSDTLYLSKGQSAAEIDYLPGKTYTVVLDENGNATAVPDSLKNYYRVNINLNNYAYPYYYDWRWRWGFTFAWWPSYYDPWYHPWYWDPWYRPWYYDPWYRPYGPHPGYYDPWYRPYAPCPYHPVVYVDPRPLVRTHRGGEVTGRSAAYSAGGRSVSGISGREGTASGGRSGASIQGRNIRSSVSEGRQGNTVNRPAGSGDGVSQAVTARTNAAAQARANAANASREGRQSHLSSSRAAYANYRPASSDAERRQQADPGTVNNTVSRGSQGLTSQRQGSSSSSVTYRRSGESVSGNGRSVGSSQRDSYSSSQRDSYSSSQSSSYSSQRSSYSSSSSSYSGGGGFSGGGGGGFSGGGGSRGGGGMRR